MFPTREKIHQRHPDATLTFIVPTIGRDTLPRALESLYAMHVPDRWIAYVVFDGLEPTHVSSDPRVYTVPLQERHGAAGCAGHVRNLAMDHVHTPWMAFLDDDDCVRPRYILQWMEELRRTPSVDVVVFRMQMPDGRILPPKDSVRLEEGKVGISFAMRTATRARFPTQGLVEDYQLLRELNEHGWRMVLSPAVVYDVRGGYLGAAAEEKEERGRRVVL